MRALDWGWCCATLRYFTKMSASSRGRGQYLVVLELLSVLLAVILLRNTLCPGSASAASVAAVWGLLALASYVVGEFESTARANYGLTLRTQAAFGLTYAAYGLLHGLWPGFEVLTVRFWLGLWLYLSILAPLIGLVLRRITRQPVLLVTDIHFEKKSMLRWWGFECVETITLEDLGLWLPAHADDHGRIAPYDLVVVDCVDPRTDYLVAGLSRDYFVDFVGIPAMRMSGYLLGPHPRQIAAYPLNGVPRRMKRIVDLASSALALVILIPLFVVVSILIKFDSPGPVFYRHRRLGRNMSELRLFKFRTMYRDADKRLKDLLAGDPELKREFEATFKLKNDPRVTRIGKFLRRRSIDELPQFFNILGGQLSLVGPRPIVNDEVKYYKPYSLLFLRVNPGLTGLWQVSGRSETSYQHRVELDTRYVQDWTFWDDLKIILKTFPAVLSRRGAY